MYLKEKSYKKILIIQIKNIFYIMRLFQNGCSIYNTFLCKVMLCYFFSNCLMLMFISIVCAIVYKALYITM